MLQSNHRQATVLHPRDCVIDHVNDRRGIDSMTLATLNFGLFRSLYTMGTSREKICAAMLLSADEFDYIVGLMNGLKLKSPGVENEAPRG